MKLSQIRQMLLVLAAGALLIVGTAFAEDTTTDTHPRATQVDERIAELQDRITQAQQDDILSDEQVTRLQNRISKLQNKESHWLDEQESGDLSRRQRHILNRKISSLNSYVEKAESNTSNSSSTDTSTNTSTNSSSSSARASQIDNRIAKLQERIDQAQQDGSLTDKQITRLQNKITKIQEQESTWAESRDSGDISRRQQRILNKKINRLNGFLRRNLDDSNTSSSTASNSRRHSSHHSHIHARKSHWAGRPCNSYGHRRQMCHRPIMKPYFAMNHMEYRRNHHSH